MSGIIKRSIPSEDSLHSERGGSIEPIRSLWKQKFVFPPVVEGKKHPANVENHFGKAERNPKYIHHALA